MTDVVAGQARVQQDRERSVRQAERIGLAFVWSIPALAFVTEMLLLR